MNNNEIEVRCLTTEIRANQSDGRTIEGYAAKFDKWSQPLYGWFREKIDARAFDDCDMSDVIMCFNHDPNQLLARTISETLHIDVDAIGLRFSFQMPNTTLGNDTLELIKRGDISKCSFRFSVKSDEWKYRDAVNGLEYDERIIKQFGTLSDVSLVTYPAYQDTEVSARHLEEARDKYFASQPKPFDENRAKQRERDFKFLTLKK